MRDILVLKAKICSYLMYDGDEDKKAKGRENCHKMKT